MHKEEEIIIRLNYSTSVLDAEMLGICTMPKERLHVSAMKMV